jgi:predicted nucleic acid-binding protein
MEREKLYLDTSVASAYFDERNPRRMEITRAFWLQTFQEYALSVSEVTIREILKTSDKERRQEMLDLVAPLSVFRYNSRAEQLSRDYLVGNLVPPSQIDDAQHIAIATENGFDFLVSWNFSHMVTARTQKRLPVINAKSGYFKQLYIVSPEAFLERSQP